MIYHTTWTMMGSYRESFSAGSRAYTLSEMREALADYIKNSSNDTFCFILQKNRPDSYVEFEKWVVENGLEPLIVVLTQGIKNPIHPSNGYNLVLVVMQSADHFQRQEVDYEI